MKKNARLYSVARNMMQVSRKTKKSPAFIKIAVEDQDAEKFLQFGKLKAVGFPVTADMDYYEELIKREVTP